MGRSTNGWVKNVCVKPRKQEWPKLTKYVDRERLYVKDFKIQTTLHNVIQHHKRDVVGDTLAVHFHCTDKTAFHSSLDGDCLFNSVSTLLADDESRSTEFRYRC
ncbi:hypothetical protein DPMN_082052 [Dreissena polymorpha]|uniref:OTU domain-containing protein n=1 Tax=Dreissena polymorpha TaxID=45954 RepID=A0A9D4BGX1_DREPO|nr:hypothetical protein DPMN_082052 [Dreissena polymorpha]